MRTLEERVDERTATERMVTVGLGSTFLTWGYTLVVAYSLLSNNLKIQGWRAQYWTDRNGNVRRVQNIIKILLYEHFEIKNWILVGDMLLKQAVGGAFGTP